MSSHLEFNVTLNCNGLNYIMQFKISEIYWSLDQICWQIVQCKLFDWAERLLAYSIQMLKQTCNTSLDMNMQSFSVQSGWGLNEIPLNNCFERGEAWEIPSLMLLLTRALHNLSWTVVSKNVKVHGVAYTTSKIDKFCYWHKLGEIITFF